MPKLSYSEFRKALFPNLIFLYGPVTQQNQAAGQTLAHNINYVCTALPKGANSFLKDFKKTSNYIITDLFTD